jgi:hypothetical protein
MVSLGTLFNINYLNRGLALIDSLREHYDGSFQLFILCLDQDTYNYFKSKTYKFTRPILIEEIETYYPELQNAKKNRSLIEYYFTLSPIFPLFVLEKFNVAQITTMDADIFFFSNPELLFKDIGEYSISITPHNFSTDLVHKEVYGRYNVSFQSFKNNTEGLDCLRKWKNQCIEWCYDRLEEQRFADQKYLDEWPKIYKDLHEISVTGSGIAPWNLDKYLKENSNSEGRIQNSLIFYHFHQLRFAGNNIIDLGLTGYLKDVNKISLRKIFIPYLKKLAKFKNNFDNKIIRHNKRLISVKEAFTTENPFFYYRFGILLKTSKIRSFLMPVRRIAKSILMINE